MAINVLDEVDGAAVVVQHPLDFHLAFGTFVTLSLRLCLLFCQVLDLDKVDAARVNPLGLGDHLGVIVLFALGLVLDLALVLDVLDEVSCVAVVDVVVVHLAKTSKLCRSRSRWTPR